MAEVKIVHKDLSTHLFVDGVEIHDITALRVDFSIGIPPVVMLTVMARNMEIISDDAVVKICEQRVPAVEEEI